MNLSGSVRKGRRLWLAGAAVAIVGSGVVASEARATGDYGQRIRIGSGFRHPGGVAVNGAGDVYVADTKHDRVVEVFPDGSEANVNAPVVEPSDVATDSSGDLFISDDKAQSIVEVLPNGSTRMIGSDLDRPSVLAVDNSGDVFVIEGGDQQVVEVESNGTQEPIGSGFGYPDGIAVNSSGDVFVSDLENRAGVIDEFLPGGTETTVGSGLEDPGSVSVGPSGDLYVGYGDGGVAEITPAGTQTKLSPGVVGFRPVADSAGNVFSISADKVWEYPIKDVSATSVQCGPEAPAGTAQTCTVTVSDVTTASDTPTGTVHFTRSGKGTFTHNGTCTLSGGSCSVRFTTGVVGSQTITAAYAGDKGHQTSEGQTTLTADPKG